MAIAKKKKLYTLTRSDFSLPHYVNENSQVTTREAGNIPIICWPDGSWCLSANVFLLNLYKQGRSRRNRGGTLHTYATNISHLIRYCYDNKILLHELSDNEFTLFIKFLQGERVSRGSGPFLRTSNSVISIGRSCLMFIECVGKLYGQDTVFGSTGRIKAEKKEVRLRFFNGKSKRSMVTKTSWHHHSFPHPSPQNRRLPISSQSVDKLREVIHESTNSIYLRKRRYVMLKLLEITGGRRSEIAAISVDSVIEASKMDHPMLKILTLESSKECRYIPISMHDEGFVCEFININRKRIISQTCGKSRDQGALLISMQDGMQLKANTITQEISMLKKIAKIEGKVCPHMFRHRFITKLFVALIEQHEIQNPDGFRRALLDTQSLKIKIQQWTGHKDVNSLDTYIDLAFDEICGAKTVFSVARAQQATSSLRGSLTQLKIELGKNGSSKETVNRLLSLIENFTHDLDI